MKLIDFDFPLERMVSLEQAAFVEFEEGLRDRIVGWLREIGLTEAEVSKETPRCLFALGILAVQRRREIAPGRFLVWCRIQTRNLVVRFWREAESKVAFPSNLTAGRVRKLTNSLDGTAKAYARAACSLGLSPGWLRRRHQSLLARLYAGTINCGGRPAGQNTLGLPAPNP